MQSKVLVVDDEKSLRVTFERFLTEARYDVLLADTFEAAVQAIAECSVDVIFADILLGAHSGLDVLREVNRRGLISPVIMITGQPTMETAAEAVRLGAFDYIPKPIEKQTLLRVAEQACRHRSVIHERERYRRHLEALFQSVQDGILTVGRDMGIQKANDAVAQFFCCQPADLAGRQLAAIINDSQEVCCSVLEKTLATRESVKEYHVEWTDHNGMQRDVILSCAPLIDPDETFLGAVLVLRDVTRLAHLERALEERRGFQNIIGQSRKMQEIYGLLDALAETETTVLITGESGTGKEVVAEALHNISNRGLKPLVKVNCSALSEHLLESELFGHVKGAFTGAVKDKVGRFQLADGGTVLLDEIGDISPAIQIKLLRVLQGKEFERVGDSQPMRVDVRVIAATNADLRAKVKQGAFREDLYYRLKVVELALPALRERTEDIPLLVDHFREQFNKKFCKQISGVAEDVLRLFLNYRWPGNVRELEHGMERAFVLCGGPLITRAHLPKDMLADQPEALPPDWSAAESPERIRRALEQAGWNKARAARLLGVNRRTIYRKMKELQISEPPEAN